MPTIDTEFLFEMYAQLNAPIDVGPGPEGHRLIILSPGGTVKGPKISGKVIEMSGGDWARIRPDGVLVLDVRVCIETDDGAVIYVTYDGRLVANNPEHLMQILNPETSDSVDPESYYFHTAPLFETGDERYAWLNGIVAVGTGRVGNGGVTYDVFAVK